KCNGPPPPAPRPKPNAAPTYRVRRCERCPLWEDPCVEDAPPGHASLTRHRHNPEAPHTLAATTQALPTPATPGPLGLGTSPTPGHLRGHPAPRPLPRLGEAVCPRARAAVIQGRRSACYTTHRAPLLQRAPATLCY